MAGKILEMSESEYHERPEFNASFLAEFSDSPDKALLPRVDKQCFDLGHQFEDYVFQSVTDEPWFDDKYSVCSLDTKEPGAVFDLVKSGVDLEKYLADNKEEYFTTKGALNKKKSNAYNWIQEHIKGDGRCFISQFNLDMVKKMASNFLDKMKVDLFGDGSFYLVREILEHAEFQKKVFWDGKKAMFDVLLVWEGTAFVIDIKTAAEKMFYQMFKSKYGPIQCRHYTEAVESLIGQFGIERVHSKLIFLVATKASESKGLEYSTCLAESHSVRDGDLYWLTENYQNLFSEFYDWDREGRPMKGYKEHTDIPLYQQS